jgi:hypothetical protein
MIDSVCILFSTVMCMLVIVRAAKLDRMLPWFRPEPKMPEPPPGGRKATPRNWWAL